MDACRHTIFGLRICDDLGIVRSAESNDLLAIFEIAGLDAQFLIADADKSSFNVTAEFVDRTDEAVCESRRRLS